MIKIINCQLVCLFLNKADFVENEALKACEYYLRSAN